MHFGSWSNDCFKGLHGRLQELNRLGFFEDFHSFSFGHHAFFGRVLILASFAGANVRSALVEIMY
jgi:hypothetical protein